MDLYFSPLACSMATRIAFYEAGHDANYLEVDPATKRVQNDGSDFFAVNPLGLVPTLRTDDGVILTENAAILQYVAERLPDSASALARHGPRKTAAVAVLHRHRAAQGPVRAAAGEDRAGRGEGLYAGERPVAAGLSRHTSRGPRIPARPFQRRRRLSGHRDQLDHGDAADRSGEMANIKAYYERTRARPSVAKAMAEEFALYKAELARHKAAA